MASFEIQESGDVEMEIVEHSATHVEEETQGSSSSSSRNSGNKTGKNKNGKGGSILSFFPRLEDSQHEAKALFQKKRKQEKTVVLEDTISSSEDEIEPVNNFVANFENGGTFFEMTRVFKLVWWIV